MKIGSKQTSLTECFRRLQSKALNDSYAYVFYREPETESVTFLASKKPETVNTFELLQSPASGYLAAPFRNRHQTEPVFIPADIQLKFSREPDGYEFRAVNNESERFFHDSELCQPIEELKNVKAFSLPDEQQNYIDLVNAAKEFIDNGAFNKVVVCRSAERQLAADFNGADAFLKLCNLYPHAFCAHFFHPRYGQWLGASPELLVKESQGSFETVALAGTQKYHAPEIASVSWSQKEIEEQAMVSRYIIEQFKKIRLREFTEQGPKTVRAGNVVHLKTEFRVDLTSIDFQNLGATMLKLLHPTSAVGGMPREPALDFLLEYELLDRELYTGYWGPVHVDQHIGLYVNLRCAKITDHQARFFAGAGITADSNPERELAETELKMDSLLGVIQS